MALTNIEILDLFDEVDQELTGRTDPISIVAAGGAAIALQWRQRSTYDVDIVSDNMPSELRSAAERVGTRRGIKPDWLNDGAKLFVPAFKPSLSNVYEGENLSVFGVDARYLLAMKLNGSRLCDRQDILFLMDVTGIVEKDDLLDLVEAAYPNSPINVKVQYVIDEAVNNYRSR